MKIDVRTVIRHPNGQPLKAVPDERDDTGKIIKEGELMTVADVLIHVALQPSTTQEPYTPREQVMRYTLALNAWKALESEADSMLNVPRGLIDVVAKDLSRIYTPVVAGQILLMLGYDVLEEEDVELIPPEKVLARTKK